jgi:Zn-dependent protease with chaperone function
MRFLLWILVLWLVLLGAPGSLPASVPGGQAARQESAQAPAAAEKPPPATYTLSPQERARAAAYSDRQYFAYFAGVLLSLAIYAFLWRAGIAVTFRSWARRASSRHLFQCCVYAPLFIVTVSLLELPLSYYSGFALEHQFGLSNQGLTSWVSDGLKSLGLAVVFGTFLVWILYLMVRRSPRRWWFYFWLASVPIALAVILINPLVIDPLFFRFTPLENSQPRLTARIEEMLHRAGLEIPRSRIFEMNASAKTKALDAYVTGIGGSKRLVVWDNTVKDLTPDETLLVVGHETGHYVLEHIPKEFSLIELVALACAFLGYGLIVGFVGRWGKGSRLEGVGDLASLPVMLLVLTALIFLATPAVCAISRYYEHQADQFALEAAYGVVPDPNANEARAFQVLGRRDLADPDPNPFIVFWLYTHPPIDMRIRFAMSYKPWAEGLPLKFVHAPAALPAGQ